MLFHIYIEVNVWDARDRGTFYQLSFFVGGGAVPKWSKALLLRETIKENQNIQGSPLVLCNLKKNYLCCRRSCLAVVKYYFVAYSVSVVVVVGAVVVNHCTRSLSGKEPSSGKNGALSVSFTH